MKDAPLRVLALQELLTSWQLGLTSGLPSGRPLPQAHDLHRHEAAPSSGGQQKADGAQGHHRGRHREAVLAQGLLRQLAHGLGQPMHRGAGKAIHALQEGGLRPRGGQVE